MTSERLVFIIRWAGLGFLLIFLMMFVAFPIGVGLIFGTEAITDMLEHRP